MFTVLALRRLAVVEDLAVVAVVAGETGDTAGPGDGQEKQEQHLTRKRYYRDNYFPFLTKISIRK